MDLMKTRDRAALLPPPGDTAVIECLNEIERLRRALKLIREALKDTENTHIVDYVDEVLLKIYGKVTLLTPPIDSGKNAATDAQIGEALECAETMEREAPPCPSNVNVSRAFREFCYRWVCPVCTYTNRCRELTVGFTDECANCRRNAKVLEIVYDNGVVARTDGTFGDPY